MNTATEQDNEKIPHKWTALRVDESEHCAKEFLAQCGGKVYQIYLYDAHERTYCCEMTPSYCLHPVDLVAEKYPEDDEAREALYEDLRETNWEMEITYMHCRHVDRMTDENKSDLTGSLEGDDGYEEAREYYQGNPVF